MATNCAPSSLAVIKRQMYGDACATSTTQALGRKPYARIDAAPDFIEGITAFFEKRTPNFPPLTEMRDDIHDR